MKFPIGDAGFLKTYNSVQRCYPKDAVTLGFSQNTFCTPSALPPSLRPPRYLNGVLRKNVPLTHYIETSGTNRGTIRSADITWTDLGSSLRHWGSCYKIKINALLSGEIALWTSINVIDCMIPSFTQDLDDSPAQTSYPHRFLRMTLSGE